MRHDNDLKAVQSLLAGLLLAASALAGCAPSRSGNPYVVRAVAPVFPDLLAQVHMGGTVSVHVTIDRTGKVVDAEVVKIDSGTPSSLTKQRHEALARQWLFAATGRTQELEIHFEYRLMPPGTAYDELNTTFELPATVIIRGAAVSPSKVYTR